MHTHEHERFNEVLRAQGYEIDRFLERFAALCRFLNRYSPSKLRIAITAGGEHYTALFGTVALIHPEIRDQMHPAVEQLIVWHACEEIEHKAVAFDVMQAAKVSYPVRILGYLISTLILFGFSAAATRMLLRQDGLSRRQVSELTAELPGGPDSEIGRRVRKGILAYFKPSFHPNQVDHLGAARGELVKVGIETATA